MHHAPAKNLPKPGNFNLMDIYLPTIHKLYRINMLTKRKNDNC